MSAVEIATTLTEVIAKGGNLLLGIGPTVDGIISGPGREPLLEAADWIRGHDNLLRGARPWATWGDADAHYWTTDGALYVADIGGRGRLGLLGSTDHVVERVVQASPAIAGADAVDDAGLPFERDEHGIRLSTKRPARRDAGRFPIVYRVEMSARAPAVELFEPAAPMTIPLAPLVDGVEPGSIVQLGDAVYGGPATVPTGVTLRGLGPERTRVTTHGGPVSLDSEARLEHLALALSADRHPADSDTGAADTGEHRPGGAAVRLAVEGDRTTVLGCAIEGLVTVTADAVRIRATRLDRLRASDAHHLRVSHCRFAGDRWTTAVEIVGGGDGEIDSCEFTGYRRAIRIVESTGAAIAGNHIESRHCGVLLERADHAHVHGNLVISTMRAVDVDGGSQAVIDGNAVFDGDSGCVVRGGAAGCEISGNHWERCRIGVLGWNAGWVHETENHSLDLHEPEHVFLAGP
jgi:alpha-L-fucosidase